jgi:O-antigen/teichoic acid export membrane protein
VSLRFSVERLTNAVRPLLGKPNAGGTSSYMLAVIARTVVRAGWSLMIPAILTVTAYGQYSLLATAIGMIAQFAVLGAPHTIVRNPGRTLPILGFVAHTLLIAAVPIAVFGIGGWANGSGATPLLAAGVAGTALYSLLTARAKARLAFQTSLLAELSGAAVLLVALVALRLRTRACGEACVSSSTVIVLEIVAVLVCVLVYALYRNVRIERAELALGETRHYLRSVYSVGFVTLFDLIVFRRIELYFLEHSRSGIAGVAVMSLAIQMATMLLLIPSSAIEAWQPRIAQAYQSGADAFDAYWKSRWRMVLVLFGAVSFAALTAPPLAVLVVFPKYRPWIAYICAFVAARVLFGIAGFFSATLYAIRAERHLYPVAVCGAIVAIVANATLTTSFGLPGALSAYVLTQGTVSIMTVVAYLRFRRIGPGFVEHASAGPAFTSGIIEPAAP